MGASSATTWRPFGLLGGELPAFNRCRQRVNGPTTERAAYSVIGKVDFYVPEEPATLLEK